MPDEHSVSHVSIPLVYSSKSLYTTHQSVMYIIVKCLHIITHSGKTLHTHQPPLLHILVKVSE